MSWLVMYCNILYPSNQCSLHYVRERVCFPLFWYIYACHVHLYVLTRSAFFLEEVHVNERE